MVKESYTPQVTIQIEKNNSVSSSERVKNAVAEKIVEYFTEKKSLGEIISMSDLYQKIISIGSVASISMKGNKRGREYYGLSFVKFTPDIINSSDIKTFTQIVRLENFQYPELVLDLERLKSIIEITNDGIYNLKNEQI